YLSGPAFDEPRPRKAGLRRQARALDGVARGPFGALIENKTNENRVLEGDINRSFSSNRRARQRYIQRISYLADQSSFLRINKFRRSRQANQNRNRAWSKPHSAEEIALPAGGAHPRLLKWSTRFYTFLRYAE